jgi:hypothetical protein
VSNEVKESKEKSKSRRNIRECRGRERGGGEGEKKRGNRQQS